MGRPWIAAGFAGSTDEWAETDQPRSARSDVLVVDILPGTCRDETSSDLTTAITESRGLGRQVVPAAPFISVVIPCANQGHLLGEAIASVWRSSRRDVEIIVVDDGSRDDTAQVGRSFGGVRCVSQPPLGRSTARNRGLAETHGQAVVFLDADARLAPNALDIGAAELEAHPMAAFVFGRYRVVDDGPGHARPAGRPRSDRQYYRDLLTHNFIGPPSVVMFRRASLERVGGFDPTVEAAAEYGLYLRIARTNRIHDHAQIVAFSPPPNGHGAGAATAAQATLTVLRRERPMIESDRSLLDAYYEGWRGTRDYYSAELTKELGAHVAAREWSGVVRKTLQLGWLHPRAAGRQAARKVASSLTAITPRARRTFPTDGR